MKVKQSSLIKYVLRDKGFKMKKVNVIIAEQTKELITTGNLITKPKEWGRIRSYLRDQGKGLLMSEFYYGSFDHLQPEMRGHIEIDLGSTHQDLDNRIDEILHQYDDVAKDLYCLLAGGYPRVINSVTRELLHMTEKWGLVKTSEGCYLTHDGSTKNLPSGEDLLPSREVIESWRGFKFPPL